MTQRKMISHPKVNLTRSHQIAMVIFLYFGLCFKAFCKRNLSMVPSCYSVFPSQAISD